FLRRYLKLDDAEGISSLSNEEVFEHLAHMGYVTNSKSLTFFKEPLQPTHKAEETAFMPHDSPLHDVHSHGNAEGSTKKTYCTALTKLVLRVKKLEYKLKSGKARRKAKIVLSDVEDIGEVSSKQGRKISQIDEDPTISLVQDKVSTASPPKVSTAVPHVYTRRSVTDKGKAIMEEPATLKKVKKRTQVQLSMDEELARKIEEEERIRFNAEQEARALQEEEEERLNREAARELQRQIDQRQRFQLNLLNLRELTGMIQTIFERVWDHVNTFIPIGSKVEKDSSKPSERVTLKIVEEEKVKEENMNPEPVLIEKKAVGIRRKTLARRRAIVPDEEATVDLEVLHTKLPIVDWESQSLGNMHVYKIIRADGNTSYHKTFESMLKSFDRQDLEVLHRLVMERFQDNTPEGYNLMLWEKKYPLTKETLQKMLKWKLEAEAESSMAFELLKFIKTQIEEQ
ncbi:hypothetical protein Tco_0642251, partial [Tanacetum coccineum]